jgi:hypothetical protein
MKTMKMGRTAITAAADMARPWDSAPVQLDAESVHLVPMGCAVLRRTTFPMKRRR